MIISLLFLALLDGLGALHRDLYRGILASHDIAAIDRMRVEDEEVINLIAELNRKGKI